jgi:replicative DNA helicase
MNLPDISKLGDRASEAATLGSMIVGPEYVPTVIEILGEDSFFFPENREIFRAILSVWAVNKDFDGLLVRSELESRGQLDLAYLKKVVDSVPTAANALYYAKKVLERKQYRGLVSALEQAENVVKTAGNVQEATSQVQEIISSLDVSDQSNISTMEDCAEVAMASFDKARVIQTNFRELDKLILGLAKGELIVVAARPSIGKSSFALDIAANVLKQNIPVLFSTLEMTPQNLKERMMSSVSKINLRRLLNNPDPEKTVEYLKASEITKNWPLYILTDCNTPHKLEAIATRMKQSHGIELLVIDYIGLMSCKAQSREQEISIVSRTLKKIAQSLDIPVVALSQLNRGVEHRTNKHPLMSDLRDSGSVEQDADTILFLYREDYYKEVGDTLDGLAEINVAKQRNGPTGTINMVFIKEYAKFDDAPKRYYNYVPQNLPSHF